MMQNFVVLRLWWTIFHYWHYNVIVFQYEIIFCIEDEADSQLKLYITSLKSKYPHVDTQVRHTFRRLQGIHVYFVNKTKHKSPFLPSPFQTFYGGEKVGVNPKVNNMYPGYTAAKYELILVSDCRIRSKFQPLMQIYKHVCLYYFYHSLCICALSMYS